MLNPCSTASVAWLHRSASARSIPAAPSLAGQPASSVRARNRPPIWLEIARIFARSPLVRIGWLTSSRLCVPLAWPSRFGRGPIMDTSDITSSSRVLSIGGLVTWAKFCLK